jgi:hypothetical protein
MQRIIKNILVFYYLWNVILRLIDGIIGMSELSLNLSANRNMESEIKMESAFITNVQYCINVYHLL